MFNRGIGGCIVATECKMGKDGARALNGATAIIQLSCRSLKTKVQALKEWGVVRI